MKIDLSKKIIIVTGGGFGIGLVTCQMLLENGATVVIAEVSEERGREALASLSKIGPCRFVQTDVTDNASVDRLVKSVMDEFGRIDILVNNAGINASAKERFDINAYDEALWKRILNVDVNGVFYCSRAVSAVMVKQKFGRIINIGSVFGSVPARKQIAYTAAKAAVHNMTKSMALELGASGILVNAVAPGSVMTPGTKSLLYTAEQQELAKRMLSHVPLGRAGDLEDIGNAVLFLCGDESKYITGHVLTVDGGWTCGYTRDF